MLPESSFIAKAFWPLIGAVKGLVLYIWWSLIRKTDKLEKKVDDTYTKIETEKQIDLRLAPLREVIKELGRSIRENTEAQKESNKEMHKMRVLMAKREGTSIDD